MSPNRPFKEYICDSLKNTNVRYDDLEMNYLVVHFLRTHPKLKARLSKSTSYEEFYALLDKYISTKFPSKHFFICFLFNESLFEQINTWISRNYIPNYIKINIITDLYRQIRHKSLLTPEEIYKLTHGIINKMK